MKKASKFDVICSKCGKIIKGALREGTDKKDTMGTICSDKDDNFWHGKCKDEKNSIKKNREEE